MMQDHTLDDIIDEVQQDFVVWLPKKVLKKIITSMLKIMFKVIISNKGQAMITLYTGGSIVKFYNRVNFYELEHSYMDLDETSNIVKTRIPNKVLKKLHERKCPRLRVWSKNSTTSLIFHHRAYITKEGESISYKG